jgi:hypothetical protein
MLHWVAMSPADPRRRWPAAKAFSLAVAPASAAAPAVLLSVIMLACVLCAGLLLAPPPATAAGGEGAGSAIAGRAPEVVALSVTMDRALTLLGETPGMVVSGDAIGDLSEDSTLAVRITGPAGLSHLRQTDPILPEMGSFSVATGSLPAAARPTPTEIHLPIPLASLPAAPGAYRVTVYVRSPYVLLGTGSTWMGRVPPRDEPLGMAFVWRAALGVHRDPTGAFFDQVLTRACSPTEPSNLQALATLSGRFAEWRFSLGIEPYMQLRDVRRLHQVDDSGGGRGGRRRRRRRTPPRCSPD